MEMGQDAQAAGFDAQTVRKLQGAYASLLVTLATEFWIKEVAAVRKLQEILIQPGQDVWEHLRNHIMDVPSTYWRAWQLDQAELNAHLSRLAAVQLKGIFCTMFDTRALEHFV